MKKWGIQPIPGPRAIELARKREGQWFVPFAAFTAAGETTSYHLALCFPHFSDDLPVDEWNKRVHDFHDSGSLIRVMVDDMLTPGSPVEYRPFVGRTITRHINEVFNALRDVIWYLEHWEGQPSLSYRYVRAMGGKIFLPSRLTTSNLMIYLQ